MATKNRIEGAQAVVEFVRDAKLPFGPDQDAQAEFIISAKAGDKWRLTRVPLTVDFHYSDDSIEVVLEGLGRPFYRMHRPVHGTRFIYDILNAKLIIEGYLNKGRGDPYEVSVYRKRSA
jgi:hypothetical protein